MVTLQVVSIWDMVTAAVIASWVGISGFMLIRTAFRLVDRVIWSRSQTAQILKLEQECEDLRFALRRKKRA